MTGILKVEGRKIRVIEEDVMPEQRSEREKALKMLQLLALKVEEGAMS